jgi:selenocysteine lyase/cysteine desulfurase
MMTDEELVRRVRQRFPYLDQCVYLNTAAAGVSWSGQGSAAARFYDDAKARGFNGMAQWLEPAAAVRGSIARLLNVNEPEVRFVGSTTEGLHLVASAIQWRSGDEIVVAADEFLSVMRACERAEVAGAIVRRVAIHGEAQRGELLAGAITSATRMLAVSHVHWATGTRVDLRQLASACRRVGALLMVDGVQALGAAPVDLGDTDIYCASVFKWLLSGFGLGLLIVRDRARETLSPAVRGYNNAAPSTELQYSHVNYPGLFALAASLDYLEHEIGWANVYARVAALAEESSQALCRRGLTVVTPTDARAGIVSCQVSDPERLRDALAGRGVYVEAREGLLRVSPHFYNTSADLRALDEALGETV